jgi:hypothetical protein
VQAAQAAPALRSRAAAALVCDVMVGGGLCPPKLAGMLNSTGNAAPAQAAARISSVRLFKKQREVVMW